MLSSEPRHPSVAAVALAILCCAGCAAPTASSEPSGPDSEFEIWYGKRQSFGRLGDPQPVANLLGSVKRSDLLRRLTFSLNGTEPEALPVGLDLRRLARPGDFNIEIPTDRLEPGLNEVILTAAFDDGTVARESARAACWPIKKRARR